MGKDVLILMLQSKKKQNRCVQLETIPFSCIHYLAVLPPGEEGIGDLGVHKRHIMVWIVVILDDL